jgi:hypothetical protein
VSVGLTPLETVNDRYRQSTHIEYPSQLGARADRDLDRSVVVLILRQAPDARGRRARLGAGSRGRLIVIRTIVAHPIVDLRYATGDNIVGPALYPPRRPDERPSSAVHAGCGVGTNADVRHPAEYARPG